jgi:hypothetical protein
MHWPECGTPPVGSNLTSLDESDKVPWYKQHAAEVGLDIPKIPVLFMKPDTSIGDPWPAPTFLPKITQLDGWRL